MCEFAPLVALAAPLAIPVENVTRLYTVEVARVETPADTEAVVRALRDWPGKVAIGGGRYSMGGQVAIAGGLHLDMRRMKKVVWLRAPEHRVRVQAGITWRDLQDVLDPHDLSVRTMQSFSNFTVGGAVSVNCHGRYVGHGPISHSVRALQLVLADGRIVEASRQENPELLAAAVGGYGAIGVITEVELDLDDNTKMERRIENVPLADYPKFFAAKVLNDRDSVMHNADLMPPLFDAPVAITWRRTDKPLTRPNRLVPRGQTYTFKRQALWALTELPGAGEPARAGDRGGAPRPPRGRLAQPRGEPRRRPARAAVARHPDLRARRVLHPAAALRGLRARDGRDPAAPPRRRGQRLDPPQPGRHAVAPALGPRRGVLVRAVLSAGPRSAGAARGRRMDPRSHRRDAASTRGATTCRISCTPRATQFERAYPEVAQLRQLKSRVDPQGRFSNSLWQKYL